MDRVGIAAEPGFTSHGGISKNWPNLFIDPSQGGFPTVTVMKNRIGDCLEMLCSLRAVSTFSASVNNKKGRGVLARNE